MPGTDWIVKINNTDYSSVVISATFDNGRRSFLDDFAVNYATVTLRNNLGQFNTLVRGNQVSFSNGVSGARFPFWLDQIAFNDEIDDDACTVTLVCSDVMGRLGKTLAAPYNIAFGAAGDMAYLEQSFADAVSNGTYKAPPTFTLPTGSLTVHQQINLPDNVKYPLAQIVNVVLKNVQGGFYLYQLTYPDWAFVPVTLDMVLRNVPAYTFGESATSSKIIWDQCGRENYGDLTANSLTLEYFDTAIPNAGPYNNTTSINSVGLQSMTFDEFNNTYSTGVALNNPPPPVPGPPQALGDWYKTVLADPNMQTFRVRVSSFAQDATAMSLFEASLERLSTSCNTLTYKRPGNGLATERVKVEGFTVTIEPEVTYYDIYFSPIIIYSQLTLNQSLQGVLGGTGMTYNQATITYDQSGWVYDTAEVGNRLGY
jgi:hypothetical protein